MDFRLLYEFCPKQAMEAAVRVQSGNPVDPEYRLGKIPPRFPEGALLIMLFEGIADEIDVCRLVSGFFV